MDDFSRTITAIEAIRLVDDFHGRAPKSAARIEEVAARLEAGADETSLRYHVAAAIRSWNQARACTGGE